MSYKGNTFEWQRGRLLTKAAFAIGALAVNIFGMIVNPLLGASFEYIEFNTPTNSVPNTPKNDVPLPNFK